MTSIYRSRPVPEPRSGGKIVRPRRTASAKTPYHRSSPSNSSTQSSNWLSRFVISPTRSIATGAGKLFLSVLDTQSSPTSSSSLSSESDSISDENGNFNDESYTPLQGNDALKKSGISEVINISGKELQPLAGNGKSKHVIEQLLMQETFSREECDRLIKIIKSRVMDSSTIEVEGGERPSEMPYMILGSGTPDLCGAAVLEAKKWLKEKKSRLGSKSDLGYGSPSLNLVTLPHDLGGEGSPVDVAKSYMRARPPWASPSIDHMNPPTSTGIQLFKEEKSHLTSRNSTMSTRLERNLPDTGSWSIQDEIRRAQSRATEHLLMSLPSSKIDWFTFTAKHTKNLNSLAVENAEASFGEKVHNFTDSVDASLNLTRGLSSHSLPDLKTKRDGLLSEAVLFDPANISCELDMAFEAIQQTEGSQDDCRDITSGQKHRSSNDTVQSDGDVVEVNGIHDTRETNHLIQSAVETRQASDPRLHDGSCSVFKEKVVEEDALANGSVSSLPNFHAGQVIDQNNKTSDNKESTFDSDHGRTEKDVLDRETNELLREPFMELPDLNLSDIVGIDKDDDFAFASQNSASLQFGVQRDQSEPDLAAPTSSSAEKQNVERTTRYNRRVRAKGVK